MFKKPLIESYEDERHLVTATTIEGALNECESFADEETLNRWRLEKREENRKGIQQEMKPIGGEVPDEAAENFTILRIRWLRASKTLLPSSRLKPRFWSSEGSRVSSTR